MSTGVLFALGGALLFGLLGCASKVAERRNCNAAALVVSLFTWATLVMLFRTATLGAEVRLPAKAILVAVVCGVCAAVAYFAFQSSIRVGKVTAGWLMMNLSAGVPAVVSIWVYREKLSPLKIGALILALASVFLLLWGHLIEEREAGGANTKGSG